MALPEHWWMLIPATLVASTVAAVSGTGGGIILLPVLTFAFGVRDAVPIYAVTQLVGNLSRVWLNRSQIDFTVVRWFCLGAIPFAILGAWCFTRLPDSGLQRMLGLFLLVSVAIRRCRRESGSKFRPEWFAPIGAMFAGLSAVFGSAGPFLAPFFLSYGLVKGAFIGTEALGTAFMHVTKLVTYQSLGAMNPNMWISGLLLGPLMVIGALMGKKIVDRLEVNRFIVMMDALLVTFGVWFLFGKG